MKKLLGLILTFLMMFTVVGCSSDTKVASAKETYYRFVKVYEGGAALIYADVETGVQYLVVDGYNGIGTEIVVDADGKPLLYEWED